MKCPQYLVEVNPTFKEIFLGTDKDGSWSFYTMVCPNSECKKIIIDLASGEAIRSHPGGQTGLGKIKERFSVKPLGSNRLPVPKEVDEKFANDYKEACLTLAFSPKASAALSRRCLQNILRDKARVKAGDLSNEIQEVITNNSLPSHLTESIDAIRNIGNFAAHPQKSRSTGEIVDVEYGEAEWLLDVLESLFDFYFVQPSLIRLKRDALNKKLAEAGKPPMK